jgi:hypothetical protein
VEFTRKLFFVPNDHNFFSDNLKKPDDCYFIALAVVHFVEVRPLKSVLLSVQLWQVQFLEIFIFLAG